MHPLFALLGERLCERALIATALSGVFVGLSGCGGAEDDAADASAEVVIPAEIVTEPSQQRVEELVTLGKAAFTQKGCIACHMANGQALTGPALANIYGESITLADGSVVERDLEYLYKSIVVPQQYISQAGAIVMPPYAYLDEQTLVGLVYFVRSLTDATPTIGSTEGVETDE
jgi:cytochrome c551/c552